MQSSSFSHQPPFHFITLLLFPFTLQFPLLHTRPDSSISWYNFLSESATKAVSSTNNSWFSFHSLTLTKLRPLPNIYIYLPCHSIHINTAQPWWHHTSITFSSSSTFLSTAFNHFFYIYFIQYILSSFSTSSSTSSPYTYVLLYPGKSLIQFFVSFRSL